MTEDTKMTEETKKINYIDQLDDNFGSVFGILCLTFIMTTINGYSILFYIFTVDSIMNPDILNDTISIDELYYQSDFYIMAITISLIIMVLNHIYGYYHILKCYSSFVPAYFVYITLFNLLFVNYYVIYSDSPCEVRNNFNCTKADLHGIDNTYIYNVSDVLWICLTISIFTTIIMLYCHCRENFKKLLPIVFVYGLVIVALPIMLFMIFCIGNCNCECSRDFINISETRYVNNDKKQRKLQQISNKVNNDEIIMDADDIV